jgi:hypothetical protein
METALSALSLSTMKLLKELRVVSGGVLRRGDVGAHI